MLKWLAGLLLCVSATAGAAPRLVYEFNGRCDDARPWTVCDELGVSSLYIKVHVEDVWERIDWAFKNVGRVWVEESNLPQASTVGGWYAWALSDPPDSWPEYERPWSRGVDIFFKGGWIDVDGEQDLFLFSRAFLDTGLSTEVDGQWRFVGWAPAGQVPAPSTLALLAAGAIAAWPLGRAAKRLVRNPAPA